MKTLRQIGQWLRVALKELECKHPWLDHSRLMTVGERIGRYCPHCEDFVAQ